MIGSRFKNRTFDSYPIQPLVVIQRSHPVPGSQTWVLVGLNPIVVVPFLLSRVVASSFSSQACRVSAELFSQTSDLCSAISSPQSCRPQSVSHRLIFVLLSCSQGCRFLLRLSGLSLFLLCEFSPQTDPCSAISPSQSCRESTMVAITSSYPTFPDWMSPAVKSFIQSALAKDPRQRSSIDRLIQHPWIVNATRCAPCATPPPPE